MDQIFKYPRTAHVAGSGIQKGDEDVPVRSLTELVGQHLVIEEKMDGANCAVSFDEQGRLLLQSRGHYLTGGPREAQFHLFKTWANCYAFDLWNVLGDRYVMYGEWLYAKHTVFYTSLPHYFMEFDLLDKKTTTFLSTPRRQELLQALPFVFSVKVLYEGMTVKSEQDLRDLVGPSHFITPDHMDILRTICLEKGVNPELALKETDTSVLMEGLYIKVEEEGVVKERYKYVRPNFLQTIIGSGSHWLDRPVIPNQLAPSVSLF